MPNQEIVRSTRGSKQRRLKFSASLRKKLTICFSALIACFSFVAVGVLASINKVDFNVENRIQYSAASLDSRDGLFLIRSYQDLQFVSNAVNENKIIPDTDGEYYKDAQYLVVNDIECPAGSSFIPIGTADHPFSGTFNGNGKRIKGLIVNTESSDSADAASGLFGVVSGTESSPCQIIGIGLETLKKTVDGAETLQGCITTTITANAAQKSTGGIVGKVIGKVTITNCYNWLPVTNILTFTPTNSGTFAVGGIVGSVATGANLSVTNCYNTGTISGGNVTAGIIGKIYGNATTEVSGCYNIGKLKPTEIIDTQIAAPVVSKDASVTLTATNCYYSSTCGATDKSLGLERTLENMSDSDALGAGKMSNLGDAYVARANTNTKFFFPQLSVFEPRQPSGSDQNEFQDDWYWMYKYFDLDIIVNFNGVNEPQVFVSSGTEASVTDGPSVVQATKLATPNAGYTATFKGTIRILCNENYTPGVSVQFDNTIYYYNLVFGTNAPETVTAADLTSPSTAGNIVLGAGGEMGTGATSVEFTLTEVFKLDLAVGNTEIARIENAEIAEANMYTESGQSVSELIVYNKTAYVNVLPKIGYHYTNGSAVLTITDGIGTITTATIGENSITYPTLFPTTITGVKGSGTVTIASATTSEYTIKYVDADGNDITFLDGYTPATKFTILDNVILPTLDNFGSNTANKVFIGWSTTSGIRTVNSIAYPTNPYTEDAGLIGNIVTGAPFKFDAFGSVTEIDTGSYLKEDNGTITFVASFVEIGLVADKYYTYGSKNQSMEVTVPDAVKRLVNTDTTNLKYQWYQSDTKPPYNELLTTNTYFSFPVTGDPDAYVGMVVDGETTEKYNTNHNEKYFFCYVYELKTDGEGNEYKEGRVVYMSPTVGSAHYSIPSDTYESIIIELYTTGANAYGEFMLNSADKCSTALPTVTKDGTALAFSLASTLDVSDPLFSLVDLRDGYVVSDAGTYFGYLKYTIKFKTGQEIAVYSNVITTVVTKAELKLMADDKEIYYGDDVPSFTVSAEASTAADGITTEFINQMIGSYMSTTYQKGDDVGTYDISFKRKEILTYMAANSTLKNYNVEFKNGTLTVLPDPNGEVLIEFTPSVWFDGNTTIIPPADPSGLANKKAGYYFTGFSVSPIFTVRVKKAGAADSEYITVESYLVLTDGYDETAQTDVGTYKLGVKVTEGNFAGSTGEAQWYVVLPKITLTDDAGENSKIIYPNYSSKKIYKDALCQTEYTASEIAELVPTDRLGYTFAGWYYDQIDGGSNIVSIKKMNADASLVNGVSVTQEEIWKQVFNANTYSLTVISYGKDEGSNSYGNQNDGGKSKITSGGSTTLEGVRVNKTVTYNTEVVLTAIADTGYLFAGWYRTYQSGQMSDLISDSAEYTFTYAGQDYAKDNTIYAKFVPSQITITADPTDGTLNQTTGWTPVSGKNTATKTVYYNDSIGALPTAKRTHYDFLGYATSTTGLMGSTSRTGTGENGTLSIGYFCNNQSFDLECNVMYRFTVNEDAIAAYDILLNTSEWGTSTASGANLGELPIIGAYYLENYDDAGGITYTPITNFYSQFGNGFKAGDSIVFVGLIVVPVGEKFNLYVSVPYYQNSVTGEITTVNCTYEYACIVGGKFVTSLDKVTNTENINLYAIWTEKAYDIALNANGGYFVSDNNNIGQVFNAKVNYGARYYNMFYDDSNGNRHPFGIRFFSVNDLRELKRNGYTFLGWFTDPENGTQLSSNMTVEFNDDGPVYKTLYAHWVMNEYTATIDCDDFDCAKILLTQGEVSTTISSKNTSYKFKFNTRIVNDNGTIKISDPDGNVTTLVGVPETGTEKIKYVVWGWTIDIGGSGGKAFENQSSVNINGTVTLTLRASRVAQVYDVKVISVNEDGTEPSDAYGTIKNGSSGTLGTIFETRIDYDGYSSFAPIQAVDNKLLIIDYDGAWIYTIFAVENDPTDMLEFMFMGYYTQKSASGEYVFSPVCEVDENGDPKQIVVYARFVSQTRRFNVTIDFGSDATNQIKDEGGNALYPGFLTRDSNADGYLTSENLFTKDGKSYSNKLVYKITRDRTISNAAGSEWFINLLNTDQTTAALLAQAGFFVEAKDSYSFQTIFDGYYITCGGVNVGDFGKNDTFSVNVTGDVTIMVKYIVEPVYVTINFTSNLTSTADGSRGMVNPTMVQVPVGSKLLFAINGINGNTVDIFNSIAINDHKITLNDLNNLASLTQSWRVLASTENSNTYTVNFVGWRFVNPADGTTNDVNDGETALLNIRNAEGRFYTNYEVQAIFEQIPVTYDLVIQENINFGGLELDFAKGLLTVQNGTPGSGAGQYTVRYKAETNPNKANIDSYYELNNGVYTKTTDTDIVSGKAYYTLWNILVKVPANYTVKSNGNMLEIYNGSTCVFRVQSSTNGAEDTYCSYALTNWTQGEDTLVTTSGFTMGDVENTYVTANISATPRLYNTQFYATDETFSYANKGLYGNISYNGLSADVNLSLPYGTMLSAVGDVLYVTAADWLGSAKTLYSYELVAVPKEENNVGYENRFVAWQSYSSKQALGENNVVITESDTSYCAVFRNYLRNFEYKINVYGNDYQLIEGGNTSTNFVLNITDHKFNTPFVGADGRTAEGISYLVETNEFGAVTLINFILPYGTNIEYSVTFKDGSTATFDSLTTTQEKQIKQVVVTISYNGNKLYTLTTTTQDSTAETTLWHRYNYYGDGAGFTDSLVGDSADHRIYLEGEEREYNVDIIAGTYVEENGTRVFKKNADLTDANILGYLYAESVTGALNSHTLTIKYSQALTIAENVIKAKLATGVNTSVTASTKSNSSLKYNYLFNGWEFEGRNNIEISEVSGNKTIRLTSSSPDTITIYAVFSTEIKEYSVRFQTVEAGNARLLWTKSVSGKLTNTNANGLTEILVKYGTRAVFGQEDVTEGRFVNVAAGTYKTITFYYPADDTSDENITFKVYIIPRTNANGREYAFNNYTYTKGNAELVFTDSQVTLAESCVLNTSANANSIEHFGLNININETVTEYDIKVAVDADSSLIGAFDFYYNNAKIAENVKEYILAKANGKSIKYGTQLQIVGNSLSTGEFIGSGDSGYYLIKFDPITKAGSRFVEYYYITSGGEKVTLSSSVGLTVTDQEESHTVYLRFTGTIETESYRINAADSTDILRGYPDMNGFKFVWNYDGNSYKIKVVGYVLTADSNVNSSKTYYTKVNTYDKVTAKQADMLQYYYEKNADGTYTKTTDTTINLTKTYYIIRSQEFAEVSVPQNANLSSYYEQVSYTTYYSTTEALTDKNFSTSGSATSPDFAGCGTYTVYYYINSTSGAYDSVAGKIEITISARELVVTVNQTEFTYNGLNQYPTNGQHYTVTFGDSGEVAELGVAFTEIKESASKNYKQNAYELKLQANEGYTFVDGLTINDISYYYIQYFITQKEVAVVWDRSADGKYVYRARSAKYPTVASVEGAIDGETINNFIIELSVKGSGSLTSVTADASTYKQVKISYGRQYVSINSGTYTATLVTFSVTGGQASNYRVSDSTGMIEYQIVGDEAFIKWPDSNRINITFDAVGGLVSGATTMTNEMIEGVSFGAFGELPVATKSGYRFVGWYTQQQDSDNSALAAQITSGTIVNDEHTTLYAWYSTNIIMITLNGADADTMGTVNLFFKAGSEDIFLNLRSDESGNLVLYNQVSFNVNGTILAPYKKGVSFKGYMQRTGDSYVGDVLITTDGAINKAILNISDSTTLYAKWTSEDEGYTITYELNGGIADFNPTTYTINTETFMLNNPDKENYEFIGWTGSNGSTPSKSVYVYKGTVGNLTFVANWQRYQYQAPTNVTIRAPFIASWDAVDPFGSEVVNYIVSIYDATSNKVIATSDEIEDNTLDLSVVMNTASSVPTKVYIKVYAVGGVDFDSSDDAQSSTYSLYVIYFYPDESSANSYQNLQDTCYGIEGTIVQDFTDAWNNHRELEEGSDYYWETFDGWESNQRYLHNVDRTLIEDCSGERLWPIFTDHYEQVYVIFYALINGSTVECYQIKEAYDRLEYCGTPEIAANYNWEYALYSGSYQFGSEIPISSGAITVNEETFYDVYYCRVEINVFTDVRVSFVIDGVEIDYITKSIGDILEYDDKNGFGCWGGDYPITDVTSETEEVYRFNIHKAALTAADAKNGLTIEGVYLKRIYAFVFTADVYIKTDGDLPFGSNVANYYPSDDELPELPNGYEWGSWYLKRSDIWYECNIYYYNRDKVKSKITFPVDIMDENGAVERTFEGEIEEGITLPNFVNYLNGICPEGYELDNDNSQCTYTSSLTIAGVTKITFKKKSP